MRPEKKKLSSHKRKLAEDFNYKLLSFFKASYFFVFILFPLVVQQIFTVPFPIHTYSILPPPSQYLFLCYVFFLICSANLGKFYSPLDNFPRCHKDSKVCAMCAVYFRCKIPWICCCPEVKRRRWLRGRGRSVVGWRGPHLLTSDVVGRFCQHFRRWRVTVVYVILVQIQRVSMLQTI